MKKILGLDIGTTSIGWAIVEATEEKKENERTNKIAETDINNDRIGIHKNAVGVRIISQDTANIQSFNEGKKLVQGSTLTPTANRRVKRGSRRLKSRYKLRRGKLDNVLAFLNIVRDEKYYTNERKNNADGTRLKRGDNNDIGKALYELRDKAIREKISLPEIGRILLHLNQWRGYSSDRFAIEETPKFDYHIAELVKVDNQNKIAHFDNDKKEELKYYQIAVRIKFEEPYNIGDKENENFVSELNGYIFKKEIDFKIGDFITVKEPELKQDKKGRNIIATYYKFTLTTPDPTDWNYKYQTLQKTLAEWCNEGKTVGSYFYHNFYENKNLERIRNNVVNRNWYEDEFNKIWDLQFEKHKGFFEKIKIEDVVKIAFKDYQAILNEIKKKEGIKEQLKCLIKDKIIFFQRPWQQVKNKGQCQFEFVPDVKKEKDGSFIPNKNGKSAIDKTGKEIFVKGRTVIPRSHPLYQEYRIWQKINDVRIFLNTPDKQFDLFNDPDLFEKHIGKSISDVKQLLFCALQKAKFISWKFFAENELELKKKAIVDETTGEVLKNPFTYNFRKQKRDGSYEDIKLKGYTTKLSIKNVLSDFFKKENFLIVKLDEDGKEKIIEDKTNEWFDRKHPISNLQPITNLQFLWELIYDITETKPEKVVENIKKDKESKKHFPELAEYANALSKIKFDDAGMANLSAKALRQLLPLMSGGNSLTEKANKRIKSLLQLNNSSEEKVKDDEDKLGSLKNFISDKKSRTRLSKFNSNNDFKYLSYWEAAAVVYGSHSTKSTIIQSEITRVQNRSMNNPVVEKIVNETISIVNEIYKRYGFDEVRIELSRELKASMDERQQMWEAMNNNADKNEWAKQMLRELKSKSEHSNSDLETSNKNNLDKIKIIEDVVKFKNADEYKQKFKEYKLDEPSKSQINKYLMWLEQIFRCPYTNQPIPLTDVFARGKVVEIEHILPKERYYLNSYANKVITWREVNQAKANNGNRTAFEFIVSKRVEETVRVGKYEFALVSKESWEDHVKSMFPKGGKRTNLLRKEIPEDPINRTLKETQYISKKLKEKLAELVGEQKVWVTSGAVTDILRERWHLNNIFRELLRNRFENFKIPTGKKTFTLKTVAEQEKTVDDISQALSSEKFELFKIPTGKTYIEIKDIEELKKISDELKNLIRQNIEDLSKIKTYKYSSAEESFEMKNLTHWTKQFDQKRNEEKDVEIFEGFSKRLDHRHHAMDAIIIACTKQNHIQYINSLNAINTADFESDKSKKAKYAFLKNDVCIGNSSNKFFTPWSKDIFIADVKNAMNEIVVSHKNTRLLISPSKNMVGQNKVASIRGELHKETNYAKKNYFEGEKTAIKKLIPHLLKLKKENQYQSMVHPKMFEEIIRETVLKEKYQKMLTPLFQKYENEKLNDALCKELSKSILKEIIVSKLFTDSKTNLPLEWLSTYSEKDKSVRPNGLSMDLNSKTTKIDEIKSIADPRIKRIAEYRRSLIISRKNEIDSLEKTKAEKDKLKREAETLPLYSNAIYEVRVKKGEDIFEWIELKDFNWTDFQKIEYAKKETTLLVQNKLKEVDFMKLKTTYFDNPIFLSQTPILIKKVRQKAYFQDLYEVTKGRYVYSSNMFMVYFFKNKNDEKLNVKREIKFLKFIDAISIVNSERPNQIDYKNLIEKEKINSELLNNIQYDLLFTLAKNDLVYLPTVNESFENIDWDNISSISSKLFIVKDMNPSLSKIVFQQFYKADTISISEADAKLLFKNPELKAQTEEIKYGVIEMMQTCIKVFADKLGKKIVPYWEFPNGCWDKETAKKLGLIPS